MQMRLSFSCTLDLSASPEQLDRWSERVLKAESIQGVLAE